LISKIIFFLKYYINIFLKKKQFTSNSKDVSSILFIYLNEKWPKIGSITCNHVGLCVHVFQALSALWSPLVSFSHVSLHINFTRGTNKKYKNKPTYQLLVSAFPSSNQHVDIRLLEIVSHINGLDHFSDPIKS